MSETEETTGAGPEELSARKFVKENHCQGACEVHNGDVKLVTVMGWGYFAYCESAISEDESRGLSVERVTK